LKPISKTGLAPAAPAAAAAVVIIAVVFFVVPFCQPTRMAP
jgi:hypothetical protein